MRLFLLLITLCVAAALPAKATPISSDKGEQYYKNCMSTPDLRLLPGTQDVFCQCTQKFMLQNMTYEDLVGLKNNERASLNKMMVGVYAHCLQYPVHDDIYAVCQKQGVDAATCNCLAGNIGKYTESESVRLLGSVLDQYPNAFDPVAAIKQTPEFEAKTNEIATQCGNGTLK